MMRSWSFQLLLRFFAEVDGLETSSAFTYCVFLSINPWRCLDAWMPGSEVQAEIGVNWC